MAESFSGAGGVRCGRLVQARSDAGMQGRWPFPVLRPFDMLRAQDEREAPISGLHYRDRRPGRFGLAQQSLGSGLGFVLRELRREKSQTPCRARGDGWRIDLKSSGAETLAGGIGKPGGGVGMPGGGCFGVPAPPSIPFGLPPPRGELGEGLDPFGLRSSVRPRGWCRPAARRPGRCAGGRRFRPCPSGGGGTRFFRWRGR